MSNPTPTTQCPDWCVMHMNGRHVGALDLGATVKGYNIYTRPVDYGDGEVGAGLEVVVAKPDGTEVTRVDVAPGQVTEAAWMSELNASLAAFETGTPVSDEREQQ